MFKYKTLFLSILGIGMLSSSDLLADTCPKNTDFILKGGLLGPYWDLPEGSRWVNHFPKNRLFWKKTPTESIPPADTPLQMEYSVDYFFGEPDDIGTISCSYQTKYGTITYYLDSIPTANIHLEGDWKQTEMNNYCLWKVKKTVCVATADSSELCSF